MSNSVRNVEHQAEHQVEQLSYDDSDVIFSEGDASQLAYRIESGVVELFKTVDDTEIHIVDIGEGDVFGEMGVLDGSPRSASARARGEVSLAGYDRESLTQLIHEDAAFALPIMNQLVANLRATSERLAHSQFNAVTTAAEETDAIEEVQGFRERVRLFFQADRDLVEFQPDAVEIERRRMPGVAYVLLGTLVSLLVAAIFYASLVSVDTKVTATGSIGTTSSNIILQPLETSTIRTIEVKPGDSVRRGQVLATLDPTFIDADVDALRATMAGLRAQEKRLETELAAGELADFSDRDAVNLLEREVFQRRQFEYGSRLETMNQRIKQVEAQVTTAIQDGQDVAEQVSVLKEIEDIYSTLLDSGNGTKLSFLSTKNQRLSLERDERRIRAEQTRYELELLATRAERETFISEWRSSVASQLVKVRREIEGVSGKLTKSERRSTLIRITAPADGIVLSIAERSAGSVIQQAEALFTLVPSDVPLRFKAHIQPKDVSQVQVGDPVRIKLDAVPFQKHGIVEGRVSLISEDTVQRDIGGRQQAMYALQIDIENNDLHDLPENFRLLPGMTASGDIKVGKRRIITYFTYPILRTLDTSMREP